MDKSTRKLNIRAFVALMVAMSGFGLPFTGIANHVYGFAPLTLARHAWMSAHNALGLLFVVFSVWHAVLNRRVLWSHLRRVGVHLPSLSREAMLAAALVTFVLLVIVGHAYHAGA